MLGPRAAWELSWCARCALLKTRCAGRPAVEDWLAALDSATLRRCRRGRGCRHRRRLVHGTRPRLGHHHASWSRRRLDWRCRLRLRNLCCRWVRLRDRRSACCGRRCLPRACGNLRLMRSRLGCRRRDCCRRSLGLLDGRRRGGLGRSGLHRHRRLFGRFRLRCRSGSRRGLHHHRCNHGDGGSRGRGSCRSLGYHSACRRLRCDCRLRRRNDSRCWPRLRHNLARLRLCDSGRCGNRDHRRSRLGWRCLLSWCGSLAGRHMAPARFVFVFFLLGQNGLHHVAGLGDVREIDFRGKCLGCARRPGTTSVARVRPMEVFANLIRLVLFDRTRVSLALSHTQFPEHIEDLSALDFQLAREIVNSNLAHPPLFRICCPSPFSRS